ncbi:hypothetical protein GQ600_16677 [Phytophthora cactorum]|nr:hypothetical protein GQ600_16677 [Phytophthora cactorum]
MYNCSKGFTNQVQHLLKNHTDYQEFAVAAFCKGNRRCQTSGPAMCFAGLSGASWTECPSASASVLSWGRTPRWSQVRLLHCRTTYTYFRDGVVLSLPDPFGLVIDGGQVMAAPLHRQHGGFLRTHDELTQAKELLETLSDFQEVIKALQDLTLILIGVRRVFDWEVWQYPAMKGGAGFRFCRRKLPSLGDRYHQDNRRGVGGHARARSLQRIQIRCSFAANGGDAAPVFGARFSKRGPSAYYVHTSVAKLVQTDMRQNMDVNMLKVLMFYPYNRDSWGVGSVQGIRRKIRN